MGDQNPLWGVPADCAFPCATQNEISEKDAENLVAGGVRLVAEGANMPTVPAAVERFRDAGVLFAPSKAANAGGVAVSGLEMAQNMQLTQWSPEEVDRKLQEIMSASTTRSGPRPRSTADRATTSLGANIAGFVKVADAMLDESPI